MRQWLTGTIATVLLLSFMPAAFADDVVLTGNENCTASASQTQKTEVTTAKPSSISEGVAQSAESEITADEKPVEASNSAVESELTAENKIAADSSTDIDSNVATESDIAVESYAADGGQQYATMDVSDSLYQCGTMGPIPSVEDGIWSFRESSQRVSDEIISALRAKASSLDISAYNLLPETLREEFQNVLNGMPEFFYVVGKYSYHTVNGRVTTVLFVYNDAYTDVDIAAYNSAVQKALSCVNDQMNDTEKALALHDYLAEWCKYDYNYKNYNAYNALVQQSAVCQGYMLAYEGLLQSCGIDTEPISSNDMDHTWNRVNVGGSWYNVDVTWDSSNFPGTVMHNYFLLSDAAIRSNHTSWNANAISCTDTRYDSGAFWQNLYSMTCFSGNTCYYFGKIGSQYGLLSRNGIGQNPVLHGNRTTQYGMGSAALWAGVVYYNSANVVYAYDITADTTYKTDGYTVDTSKQYMTGVTVRNQKPQAVLRNKTNSDYQCLDVQISKMPGNYTGWKKIGESFYWYENGMQQGLEGRGKEIYDPGSDAWYWLDSVQAGAKAVSKDVYQESSGGKWVRYDANGHMVKGWNVNDNGTYYFDLVTGAMAKRNVVIDNAGYIFDENTGILQGQTSVENGWLTYKGKSYWYENCVKQGLEGRGKEIYDPASDAWYWLDSVQDGAKAVSKDVYQESNGGKWVRYDENGHMVKNWQTTAVGTYYFDLITGAMAKGDVLIEGNHYYFDEKTGVLK